MMDNKKLKSPENVSNDTFQNRTLTAKYKNLEREVHVLYILEENGEIFFDPETDSAERYFNARLELVKEYKKSQASFLKEARKSLKLTQQEAATITGGGVNAFSRYENCKTTPQDSVVNLFKILLKHPNEVHYLLNKI